MDECQREQATGESQCAAGMIWSSLTWSELNDWATERVVMRGRTYQQTGRVHDLCASADGTLIAWVFGSAWYAVRVHPGALKSACAERITSACTCPVRSACKHAVAVIVQFLDAIRDGTTVDDIAADDPRQALIEGEMTELDFHMDPEAPPTEPLRQRRRHQCISDKDIRQYLESRSAGELVDLLMSISARDSETRKALVDASALSAGRLDDLVAETRSELRALSDIDVWREGLTGGDSLPDFSRLEARLRALLDHSHADDVVELGDELLRRGSELIEQSNDEGETSMAIGGCITIMFEALMRSSRADEDKIVDAIDLTLFDQYGLCDCFQAVGDRPWTKGTWSAVADQLRARLGDERIDDKDPSAFQRRYRRSRLGDWVIMSLDRAGRTSEATEVCIAEACIASDYVRAVERLIEQGDDDRAVKLARTGLDATPRHHGGVISNLQDLLCAIAVSRGDWLVSAAVTADRFFERPGVRTYRDLVSAAERAGHKEAVERSAMAFLKGGGRPVARRSDGRASKRTAHPWPLPDPPKPKWAASTARSEHDGPHFDVLIELAIADRRPDDVLYWYDQRAADERRRPRGGLGHDAARVAEAIEETHPDRAIELYIAWAKDIVAHTNPRTYPDAGRYLTRVRCLLEGSGRAAEWPGIIRTFRAEHRPKRRLMEVLDTIEHPAIIAKRAGK